MHCQLVGLALTPLASQTVPGEADGTVLIVTKYQSKVMASCSCPTHRHVCFLGPLLLMSISPAPARLLKPGPKT